MEFVKLMLLRTLMTGHLSLSIDTLFFSVSLASFFEAIINKKVVDRLNRNLLSDKQYGFRSARSTAGVLTTIIAKSDSRQQIHLGDYVVRKEGFLHFNISEVGGGDGMTGYIQYFLFADLL